MSVNYIKTKVDSYKAWAEAMNIFDKYDEDFAIACEEDVIYAGPSPTLVNAADKQRLDELGWTVDDDYDCFYKYL